MTQLETKDGTTTYTYDKNGNRISSQKNDEKLDYIYDTENRILAVKDKAGLLFAALYDGDDNRVFTASRKEGKHSYRLFKREEKKKSPHTAPNGEAHSLFWYGFSQNVLQALSSLPQTIGTIWHEMFDDVSTAYHKKVAKDRANEEGLVVNPPDLGNLPGEGEVTYASEVKEVLIPYTTREDSFHYYEERNYVNDVNRKHTEVLQTYDRELKARETYTYGQGRSSYHKHETGDTYQYLTNQAGSVTGLTKDGQAVASSKYQLYGSTKDSTDETGNPYAYNGEARDSTGLDYLRARYYDSGAGTFLTEDSYQGELADPLSQNRYSYVHNNPVNYTDPSGHVRQSRRLKPARRRASQRTNLNLGTALGKTLAQIGNTVVSAAQSIMSHAVQEIQYTAQYVSALIQAPAEYRPMITNLWQQARAMRQSVYDWGTSLTREAQNIDRNWTKALEETIRHVCEVATKATDAGTGNVPSMADFRKLEEASKYGLTVEAKAKIDKMSMSDLKAKYGNVIGNYNTYTGTGYFNPLGSGENRAVITRYKQLKAEEDARIAASIAEMRKYHYTNIYKTIAETGLRPDGTPASQIEKDIAPYIPYLDAGLSSLQAITMTGSAYVGYQNYYGKPVLGVDTTWLGKPNIPKVREFKPGELESHFNKHGQQIADSQNKSSYSIQQYLDEANNVIQNGTYIPEMNGYAMKIGGTGKSTKYAFVGLDRTTGNITTYHIKYAKQILKKSPNFEVNP